MSSLPALVLHGEASCRGLLLLSQRNGDRQKVIQQSELIFRLNGFLRIGTQSLPASWHMAALLPLRRAREREPTATAVPIKHCSNAAVFISHHTIKKESLKCVDFVDFVLVFTTLDN